MKFSRNFLVSSFDTRPSSLMRPFSNCMYASTEFMSGELQKARMLRRCCCATAVPIVPGEVPMTADGFRVNASVPYGRLAQSIALFSAQGMERLYVLRSRSYFPFLVLRSSFFVLRSLSGPGRRPHMRRWRTWPPGDENLLSHCLRPAPLAQHGPACGSASGQPAGHTTNAGLPAVVNRSTTVRPSPLTNQDAKARAWSSSRGCTTE